MWPTRTFATLVATTSFVAYSQSPVPVDVDLRAGLRDDAVGTVAVPTEETPVQNVEATLAEPAGQCAHRTTPWTAVVRARERISSLLRDARARVLRHDRSRPSHSKEEP